MMTHEGIYVEVTELDGSDYTHKVEAWSLYRHLRPCTFLRDPSPELLAVTAVNVADELRRSDNDKE